MGLARDFIELKLPSRLGYEKLAMTACAMIAEEMGFSPDKIEDLKTAVSEACINAIEHGNRMQKDKKVTIVFRSGEASLVIDVLDEGKSSLYHISEKTKQPAKIEEQGPNRGLGLFLIRKLMDSAEFIPRFKGTQLRMVVYLRQGASR